MSRGSWEREEKSKSGALTHERPDRNVYNVYEHSKV